MNNTTKQAPELTMATEATSFKGLKRSRGKLNEKGLIKAIGEGLSYNEAGRLAGSKAKNPADSVFKRISSTPRIKRSIIEVLEKRQRWILNAIKHQDIKTAPLQVKGILFGILTEKLQLLKGDPTQRIETIPKMVFEDTKKVKKEGGEGRPAPRATP